MTCNNAQTLMMKYFDKNINDIEEAQLKQHIKTCNNCTQEFTSLKDIFDLVEADTCEQIVPPVDFEVRVMDRLKKEVPLYSKRCGDNSYVYNILAIALSFVFLIMVGGLLLEVIKSPLSFIATVQDFFSTAGQYISVIFDTVRGILTATMGVAVSAYQNYYYVYIVLAILLFVIHRIYVYIISDNNGGTDEKYV